MDVRQQWLVVNNVRMYICNYTYLLAFYTHTHIYIYISACILMHPSVYLRLVSFCFFLRLRLHVFYVSLCGFMHFMYHYHALCVLMYLDVSYIFLYCTYSSCVSKFFPCIDMYQYVYLCVSM